MLINEDFYEICFNTLLEGICIIDKKGVIVMNNTPFEEIFGYKKGELYHKNINVLLPEKLRNTHLQHLNTYFKNPKKFKKGKGRDFYGLKKNGKIIHVEIGLNYFNFNDETFAKAIITDISLRKEEERKIKELNVQLKEEVKKQTKDLTIAVKKLKKANKKLQKEIKNKILAEKKAKIAYNKEKELNVLQTKFLSLASHEFKTPLSGILTSISLIDRYNQANYNDNINNHVQTIKKLVNQLNSNLDDFLLLEKTETHSINYQLSTFNFCAFFHLLINNTQSVLKLGQRIKLNLDVKKIIVYHDKNIIEIIFRNILYNAIKYSPANSDIHIKINANTYLTVTVEDNGIGIPLEDQKLIFNRFFRAKNALHFQGTGIGLNIVKQHLENLGGSISFKSIENKGTTFIIKLPLKM